MVHNFPIDLITSIYINLLSKTTRIFFRSCLLLKTMRFYYPCWRRVFFYEKLFSLENGDESGERREELIITSDFIIN